MDPLDPEIDFVPGGRPRPRPPSRRPSAPPKKPKPAPGPPSGYGGQQMGGMGYQGYGYPGMQMPGPMGGPMGGPPQMFPGPGGPPMMYPPGPPQRPMMMMMHPGMRPPPPPPPRPPPTAQSAWSEHMGPNGMPYYYNAMTKQSTWERPPELAPPPPPPGPPPAKIPEATEPNNEEIEEEQANNARENSPKKEEEWPQKLPNSPWGILLTNKDNEFYVNLVTKERTWEMPDEIAELVGQILAEPEPMEDFEDEDGVDGETNGDTVLSANGGGDASVLGEAGILKRKLQGDDEVAAEDAKKARLDETVLTNEQRNETFMKLLRAKEVSPFTTWERELPKIIHDSRYILVTSLKERRQLFENYCKLRVAELREEQKTRLNEAKEGFTKLLEEMVNYRTTWEDFARRYRKDSRFTAITEDREKRAMFIEFVNQKKVERVKQKREEKQKLSDEFNDLLAECAIIGPKTLWREARKEIENDPRYVALAPADREELFYNYRKKLEDEEKVDMHEDEKEKRDRERKAREAASLKEREDAVRKQMAEVTREARGKRNRLQREDSETTYKALLIDAVVWQQVRIDMEKIREHTAHIFSRRLAAFHNLIDEVATITTTFDEVSEEILRDPRSQQMKGWTSPMSGPYVPKATKFQILRRRRLHRSGNSLKRQADRVGKAKQDLEDALKENKFILFHVRNAVQSAHVQAVDKGKKEADNGEEWRLINLDEIKQVLTENKAYNDYGVFGQERERMVFTYVKSVIDDIRGGIMDKDKEKFDKFSKKRDF
ncbi:hypothetical protein BC829DRAFT_404662, partial [Chytridium lagenaria]